MSGFKFPQYRVRIIADSICNGSRITTIEATFPRFILAEANTHRMLSRNSASSRAIPVERRIKQVLENPFVPEAFGVNKRGMQADAVLDDRDSSKARDVWLRACAAAVHQAEHLVDLGVHKQHANRVIETYAYHTAIFTATEWQNFFNLRTDKGAQPEMQIIAKLMLEDYENSDPVELSPGEWHLPYVDYCVYDNEGSPDDNPERELPVEQQVMHSVVRCAAVSYERQLAERTLEQVIARHDEMTKFGHWSPFEHQAVAVAPPDHRGVPFAPHYRFEHRDNGRYCYIGRPFGEWVEDGWFCGNFRAPWLQYRKMLPGEAVFRGA